MYTFIFNRCLLKINFSSVNSLGWTDDSHVLLGMGWISNTIWFVAQSRVEQLWRDWTCSIFQFIAALSPARLVSSVSKQSGGALCTERCRRTYAKPALDVFSSLSGINTCFSLQIDMLQQCWVTAQVFLCNGNPPQPWGRGMKVWALGFWSVLCVVMTRTSAVHSLCYHTCMSPGAGYTLVPAEIDFLPPYISQAFPIEKALLNMVWPPSRSYYWTIKVILSLQIYIFMPFL